MQCDVVVRMAMGVTYVQKHRYHRKISMLVGEVIELQHTLSRARFIYRKDLM